MNKWNNEEWEKNNWKGLKVDEQLQLKNMNEP